MKRLLLISLLSLLNFIAGAQEYKALILPVQFRDLTFSCSPEQVRSLADSLALYYDAQFYGSATFRFDIAPVATLHRNHAYYGADDAEGPDARIAQAVAEACRLVDADVNFASYSTDGNKVDKLLVMVPGKSETDTTAVDMFWPRYISLDEEGESLVLDGRNITNAGIFTENDPTGSFTGIGNAAHEFGHALGLSDFYDTDGDGSGGHSRAFWGSFDLMDGGNRNAGGHLPPNLGAANLHILGTGLEETPETSSHVVLEPLPDAGRFFILHNAGKDEFFTVENRQEEGWDASIGGSGLLISHIDRSDNPAGWSDFYRMELDAYSRWEKNQVNCNPQYQGAAMLPADSTSHATLLFPSPGHSSLGPETDPPLVFHDGTPSQYSLLNISREGRNISFDLVRPVTIMTTDVFQTTVIVTWKSDPAIGYVRESSILALSGADTLASAPCHAVSDSIHAGTLAGLTPNKEYTLKILATGSDGSLHSALKTVKTHPYRSRVYPFIYLKTRERNSDGSFIRGAKIPLQVFNAPDAVEIHWYMNGREITADGGGFTLRENGTLKVELYREDGSKDIITKEITVR